MTRFNFSRGRDVAPRLGPVETVRVDRRAARWPAPGRSVLRRRYATTQRVWLGGFRARGRRRSRRPPSAGDPRSPARTSTSTNPARPSIELDLAGEVDRHLERVLLFGHELAVRQRERPDFDATPLRSGSTSTIRERSSSSVAVRERASVTLVAPGTRQLPAFFPAPVPPANSSVRHLVVATSRPPGSRWSYMRPQRSTSCSEAPRPSRRKR